MSWKGRDSSVSVGIVAMAHYLPQHTRQTHEVFQQEDVRLDGTATSEIGIDRVHVFDGEWKSDLALAAANECLLRANLKATDLGIIVDFSVMPQDYVVPSWCVSNKIQYELGAKNAFNLGFGGGGTTNLLVAIHFVSSLLKQEKGLDNALLIATDVSIPGNRVINPDSTMTVLGDGASAVLIAKGSGSCEILGTELWSDGSRNDVFCIPGGGLAFPDRLDLYRLRIRKEKYSATVAFDRLRDLCCKVSQNAGVNMSEVVNFIGPNISAIDQSQLADTIGFAIRDPFSINRRRHGHVQGTDFIINLSDLLGNRGFRSRELGLLCSHGWGFLSGATLIRC